MAKAGETQDRCTQYALDVVSGKITAGEYVRLACQRHLDDIEKSKAAPYKYYFDVEKSEEIINFAEELTIAEGEENEHVTAHPFQCFILGSLNGWRTKEKSYRRFRTSYVQLGRQNGKSFINGILACYYGNFDGYKYGKIFCTATKQDQANIVFDEVAKFINSDPTSGRQYVFSTDEVMHFKTSFSFDGITGLPVQQILRDTVAGASESQAFMNNLYESGLTAKATLEYTGELNEKAKSALVKSFEEFGSGAKNTGKILPVPLGMKLTPLDIKLTDSQFFELKKYNALQIAGAFGVKPNQINDYSKSSYSNSEMQQLSFYVDTELFIIKQYEEEINFKMLPDEDADDGYYYKFNEKVLFRTDSKTQMEYLRNGVGGMIIKPNEARRKLDMEDAEGGDVLLANGSIVPLTMAGAAYLKGKSEQENADEPEQPEEETEPDTEQPDTATEPDETDEAEDEDEQEGGE